MKATVELRTWKITSSAMTPEQLMDAQRRIYGINNIVEISGWIDYYEDELESVVQIKAWVVFAKKTRKLKWVYE